VSDAVLLEEQGVPTILLCHDALEPEARAQLAGKGAPDLPVLIVDQPQGERIREDAQRRAREVARQLAQRFGDPN